jgi:hypothetical protein
VAPKRLATLSLAATGRQQVAVAGQAKTDPASSSAVVSLTVAAGEGRGSLYAYPAGGNRPKVPVLAYARAATTVQTSVPVGRGGAIVIENQGNKSRSVAVDVAGAYEPASLAGGHSLGLRARPMTVVDTGSDLQLANLGDGATKDFSVSDAAPKGTDSVLLQVTAKAAKQPGTLTFWSAGTARPDSVDLSVTPGQSVSGTVVARVGDGRSVRVRNSGAKGVKVRITVLGSFR